MNTIHVSKIKVIILGDEKQFKWMKLVAGFRRPTVALVAGVIAYYLGVDDVIASSVAGIVVERLISTGIFLYEKYSS